VTAAPAPTTRQWLRDAAQRVSRGSERLTLLLARRITGRGAERLRAWGSGVRAWLGAVSGFEWLLRAGCLVAAALVARKALLAVAGGIADRADEVVSGLMWPASIVWVVVAYRIGREDWRPRDEEPAEPGAAGEGDDQAQADGTVEQAAPAGPPLPTLQQLAESLARVGTPHAHIAVMAEDLGATPQAVRAALDRCGVPVEPVRMRGRGSSTGIKAGSLPTPRPTPDGVVAAGQPANNDNNNARALQTRQGVLIITDDADNPYRHHVHHTAKG
jgi:hypothetical protein